MTTCEDQKESLLDQVMQLRAEVADLRQKLTAAREEGEREGKRRAYEELATDLHHAANEERDRVEISTPTMQMAHMHRATVQTRWAREARRRAAEIAERESE